MAISKHKLSLYLGDDFVRKYRLTPTSFHTRVRKFFCPRMVEKGLCTRACENCKKPLAEALKGITPDAKSPEAVITWRLRGAVAILAEKRSEAEKQPIITTDELGLKVESTGFGALEKMFGGPG
jgi:hypothetical protein